MHHHCPVPMRPPVHEFMKVAKEFLEKAGKNEGKFTYAVDGHTFNFLAKGGFSES